MTYTAREVTEDNEKRSPWGPFFEFKIVPIVEIEKAVPVFQRVQSWRESIK